MLDSAIPEADRQKINDTLNPLKLQGLDYHSLLTRQAGQRKFISVHILMPGLWTIQKGHDLIEKIEADIRALFDAPVTVFTHLEPIEDPLSMNDIGIDRKELTS